MGMMKDFWREFVPPVFICLIILQLSSALLEPSPFPATLRECYDFRSYNMTPSDEIALQIQSYCYKQYQYQQIAEGKVWSAPNITQEGMNYINSLFRQLFGQSNEIAKNDKLKRQKRQVFPFRVRREVRSPGAFAPFARCIRELQNTMAQSNPQLNAYQALAVLHTGATLQSAHGGAAFLPWHRIYLLLVETACQGIPVPYWDSTVDNDMADPTSSILWSDQFFGNGDGLVVTGPFQNIQTVIPGDIITRELATGRNSLFTKQGLAAVLSRTRYEDIIEPKQGPAYLYSLEGHHNGPHGWVGGHLSMPWLAAFDPIFFMHHAYVDAVWELFRRRQLQAGINPEVDYPLRAPPGHGPLDIISFPPYITMRNIDAMSQSIARRVRYEPFPTCENRCNFSPVLSCHPTRRICISEARPSAMVQPGSAAYSGLAGQPGQLAASQNAPSESRVRAQARGPIRGGERFRSSPISDPRNRPGTIGNAPVAPELQAVSSQVRSSGLRGRRDVSRVLQNASNTSASVHDQAMSSLGRSYTNTFIIDGVIDVNRWVYVPIRVLYKRPSTPDGNDPTFHTNMTQRKPDACRGVGSGASKVYIASNGLSYFGTYKEYAIVDERLPVSITTTAVGIKNPDYGNGDVLLTAYDSCGRSCRPFCLTSPQGKQKYKPCSGVFKISSATPKMYEPKFIDVYDLADADSLQIYSAITFVCGDAKTWPWEY